MGQTAKKFRKTVQRQNTVVFNFEREVAQAWRDFPEAREKIMFFDAVADARLVYPEGFEGREQAVQFAEKYNPAAKIESAFKSFGGKNSFCYPIGDGKRLLFLLTEKHSHDMVASTAPVAQETTFVFDHELGHAIIPEGAYPGNKAECLADAYATIRHLQRFGADSPVIDALVANRSFDLVFREGWYGRSHFTSPVVEKILALRHEIDWDSLTPAETVQMARKFVLENEIDAEALLLLDKNFETLHAKAADIEGGDSAPLRALAEKVLSTDSSRVFKYGSAALKLYIGQEKADVLLKGEYWDNVRQKLAKKQKTVASQEKRQSAYAPVCKL